MGAILLSLRQLKVATKTAVINNNDSISRPMAKVAVDTHILSTTAAACGARDTALKAKSLAPTTRKPVNMEMVFLDGGGGGGGGSATSRRRLGVLLNSASTSALSRVP